MSFTKITQEMLNKTLTDKGDVAYLSTLSPCLDYFSLVGGLRFNFNDLVSLFTKAYFEDKATAIKLLFFTRDIRGGLGERNTFRFLLNYLANIDDFAVRKLLPYFKDYIRYDDLLVLLDTAVEEDLLLYLYKQLQEDIQNKKACKPISLLAKWLPSINTSNKEARKTAYYLATKFNMSLKEYRQTLSFLRKGMIVENNLREKNYNFDYGHVPGKAMQKYNKAFLDNDFERFHDYLTLVTDNKAKIHTDTMDVVSLVSRVADSDYSEEKFYNAAWNQLTSKEINSRTLVVRDGSASMTYASNKKCASPIDIANAFTLLFSSRLSGEFKDRFITFSKNCKYVDLSSFKTLKRKRLALDDYDDITTTNISSLYKLVLDVYTHPNFKKEDALDQILIISDMEFDYLDDGSDMSAFEYFTNEFNKLGLKRPDIVFWNVHASSVHFPVTKDESGVKLISGQSKNLIDMMIENPGSSPLDFMHNVLKKYSFVDEAIKED